MPHARFPTGHAIGLKQSHLRPANAKTIANSIINLFGSGYAIFDQPEGLAPDRLQKTICDMGVNLFAHPQGIHPHLAQNILRTLNNGKVTLPGRHHFNQRQQIDRIERMAHHDLRRAQRSLLQLGRLKSRG